MPADPTVLNISADPDRVLADNNFEISNEAVTTNKWKLESRSTE